MNIQKAILEEQAYLQDSKNGINTSLKQRLQPYGYNDLETFFNEKALYQIRQLNLPVFYDDDIPHIRENWMQKVIDKIPCIYLPRPSKTWAWLGANKLDRVDQEGLLSEGIEIANMGWPGGTIISGKDDLQISVILPRELNVNSKLFQQKYAELVNADPTDNDILVDGKKVIGTSDFLTDDLYVFVSEITFMDHRDIIAKYCPPTSGKMPSFITNITKEEFEEEVLKWLH